MLERRVSGAGVDAERDGDGVARDVTDPRFGHRELVDGGLAGAGVARPPAVERGWHRLVLGPSSVGGVPEVGKFGVLHISRGYAAAVAESAGSKDVQVMESGAQSTTASARCQHGVSTVSARCHHGVTTVVLQAR